MSDRKTYEVCIDITAGVHDDALDDLALAVKQRRDALAQEVKRTLKVGDVVRFADSVRPTYLAGTRATVVSLRPKKVVVLPVAGTYTGRFRGEIVVPPTLIEKVDAR